MMCRDAVVRPTNPRHSHSRLLERAATHAESLSGVMAPTLATYRRRHGLDAAGLAAELGCSVTALHALALCQRPAAATPMTFASEVGHLAAYIGCHADRLMVVLREVPDA